MSALVDHLPVHEIPDGTRASFDLFGYERADGGPCAIPVHVIAGRGSHPRLAAIAGVHGDEPDGMLALLDAERRIGPSDLRGRLILVPFAHPSAFAAGQRRSPVDGLDLNRVFPGSEIGTPTERLAHRLFREVVLQSEFVFTLHSWLAAGTLLPFVETPDRQDAIGAASFAAAKASGFTRIRLTTWPAGLLVRAANEAGVPGMEAEIGDAGASRPANQRAYLRHLQALLAHLGMRAPLPAGGPEPGIFHGQHARADHAGVLRVVVSLGATVSEGDALGSISDLRGREIGVIRAETAGLVVTRRSYASVAVGDIVATIFTEAPGPKR
jgi:predicted deacylase